MASSMRPTWQAHPGPQSFFVATSVYEVLYGGAAGGGKSEALIGGALRFISEPSYRALILRRTYADLQQLIDRAAVWYQAQGGVYNKSEHRWTFPSGAQIEFGHCENDGDVLRYQGREYSYLGIDELTLISEKVYLFLLTRLRSTAGLPIYVRCTANPGGPGHDWVFARWRPWLDPRDEYSGPRSAPQKPLYYVNGESGEIWLKDKAEADRLRAAFDAASPETRAAEKLRRPLSRVFIPAKAQDNPSLMRGDPGYLDRLAGLDPVTRARLVDGNWLVKPAEGAYFKRAWFRLVDARPAAVTMRVRRWDLASTENGGDWTVGVLMAKLRDGSYLVEDVIRIQQRPKGVEATILNTAKLDADRGRVRVVLPQDPGQAGVAQRDAYAKLLTGFDVRFERETGDKVTRAQAFSAQCEAGNVAMYRAPWNEATLQVLEAFPTKGVPDDDVDAAAGAFNAMVRTPVSYFSDDDDWVAPRYEF